MTFGDYPRNREACFLWLGKQVMNKKIITFILFLFLGIIALNLYYFKSLFIMYFYNIYNVEQSIMERKNFDIEIPGGLSTMEKDWYPFVMTFQDRGIASSIDEEIDITILYNFGAFEEGRSSFYNENSDYFSSFYGGYVIETMDKNRKYGYKGDKVFVEEIVKVATYDMEVLVLESIGCLDGEVTFKSVGEPTLIDYLSYDDWNVLDSIIYSKSTLHKVKSNHQAYIQYGKPPKEYSGNDFEPVTLAGRIYSRYFPEYEVTVLLYIIAPNFNIVDKTDQQILSKTKLLNNN